MEARATRFALAFGLAMAATVIEARADAGIRVTASQPLVLAEPIAPSDFGPSLKLDFDRDARAAKVKVAIEVTEGPSGADAVGFALPATSEKTVEVTYVEPDVTLQAHADTRPGTYRGRIRLAVDPPDIGISPSEFPFSFTIAAAEIGVTWEGLEGRTLSLGSVPASKVKSLVTPKLRVASSAPVTFEADEPEIWLRPESGEPLKGGGSLTSGTYQLALDPGIKAGSYHGTMRFSTLAEGAKINGAEGAAEYTYEFEITDPMATVMKYLLPAAGGVAVLGLAFGAVKLILTLGKGRGGDQRIPVEGTLDFLQPRERRPEKLERLNKHKVILGQGGDLMADARRSQFEIAGYVRGKQKVMELTRLKGTVYVNGVEAFSYPLYHGDVIKFGEGPVYEVKYVNPKITGVHVL